MFIKVPSGEDEAASDSFYKRCRSIDFLYSRNDEVKISDLHFFEKQHVENYSLIDLLNFDYRKAKLDHKFKFFL